MHFELRPGGPEEPREEGEASPAYTEFSSVSRGTSYLPEHCFPQLHIANDKEGYRVELVTCNELVVTWMLRGHKATRD